MKNNSLLDQVVTKSNHKPIKHLLTTFIYNYCDILVMFNKITYLHVSTSSFYELIECEKRIFTCCCQ